MVHAISLWFIMFGLWVALSGHMEVPMLSIGALCSLFVVAVTMRMDRADQDSHPIRLSWTTITYWAWLIVKIMQANLEVARLILRPRLQISPSVIRLRIHQRTDIGRVIYANSITLTPGTVTMDLQGSVIHVHALTKEAAQELQQGEMDRRVCRLEIH